MKKFYQKGQSLFEVIVALGVAIVVISALVRVTTISIANASFSRNQSLATKYAQEAMEKIRAYKVGNTWIDFKVFICNPNSLPDPAPFDLSLFCCNSGRINSCASFTPCNNNASCGVQVTVSWTDSKGLHQSDLKTLFGNF